MAKANFEAFVRDELASARKAHWPIRTRHEGLAVIEEEFLEFRTSVFSRRPDVAALREELVQIAAMCQRVAEDLGFMDSESRAPAD
jgi:hypothetical protein